MTTFINYLPNDLTLSDEQQEKLDTFQKYKQIFGEKELYTHVKPRQKAGFKGWDKNLFSFDEAQNLLIRQHNIAIKLGIETDRGYTVCFDKESYGNVPESVIKRIEQHSVISWDSQSGGYNNLLTVSKEAYEHLSQFKQKVTFEGDKHDLEVLTSGYALVPPSEIDKNHQYDNLQVYPEAPTVDLDSVVDILDSIPIEEKEESTSSKSHTNGSGSDTAVEHKSLPSDFDIESHFRENVAYFSGNFDNDKSHLKQFIHEVLQQERIREKVFTNPEDRSKNEKMLAIDLAWYTQNDTKIIQYFFEKILPAYRNHTLKYHENKTHREDCLNLDQYVSRPYWIQGLSFNFREQLSRIFLEHEQMTAKELYEGRIFNTRNNIESYSKKHINRGLELFEGLGLIEEVSKNIYRNKNINEEYVQELNDICENDEYRPIKYPSESE